MKQSNTLNDLLIFRKHLPEGEIEGKYVNEYHAILATEQNRTGEDLSRFFIPPSELKPQLMFASFDASGKVSDSYYSEPRCDRNFFMMRLDKVIAYLASKQDSQKPRIGFTPPK